MIITYFGKQFFKVTQGDTVIGVNPIGKDSKFSGKGSRFGAEVVLSTTNHPDYNGVEILSRGDAEPVVISGPGDYEVKGIFVKGIRSDTEIDGKAYINTIYNVELEGIHMCFLGSLSKNNLSAEAKEAIGSPDILFVPIGDNKNLLDPTSAYKLAVSFEPSLIIPMDYEAPMLKTFLKEAGEEKVAPIEKLVLKKKDLDGKEGDVVVLMEN